MLKTPLHDWHVQQGARMVDFAGWSMPVQYSSIVEEHLAVRSAAGLFDISHMGRLIFSGPDAVAFLDHILTYHVAVIPDGGIRYSLVTNEQGGILDDVLVYRRTDDFLLVVNASNRPKILDWIEQQRSEFDFQLDDQTTTQAMIAVQGPLAEQQLQPITDAKLADLKYYTGTTTTVLGHDAFVSRTGYTGEDGFEVILANEFATELCERLLKDNADAGLQPAGLGCRDTLRLEAAMPLYGHELSEQVDPFTAGLNFAVKLKKDAFIGRDALVARKAEVSHRRIGLILEGRRIAREGATVHLGETQVGEVTSGTFSPTLEKTIAMASVTKDAAATDTQLEVDIRGKRIPATVTPLPFYSRK